MGRRLWRFGCLGRLLGGQGGGGQVKVKGGIEEVGVVIAVEDVEDEVVGVGIRVAIY